jgi:putative hemolysin
MIARKFVSLIVPVHIEARNPALFYLMDLFHPILRDITMFHATLNKARQPYRITIGAAINPAGLPAVSAPAVDMLLRETLSPWGRDAPSVSLLRISSLLQGLVEARGRLTQPFYASTGRQGNPRRPKHSQIRSMNRATARS